MLIRRNTIMSMQTNRKVKNPEHSYGITLTKHIMVQDDDTMNLKLDKKATIVANHKETGLAPGANSEKQLKEVQVCATTISDKNINVQLRQKTRKQPQM